MGRIDMKKVAGCRLWAHNGKGMQRRRTENIETKTKKKGR